MESDLTKEVCYNVLKEEDEDKVEDLDLIKTIETRVDEIIKHKEFKEKQHVYYMALSQKKKLVHQQCMHVFKTVDDFHITLKKKEDKHAGQCDMLALEGYKFLNSLNEYDDDKAVELFLDYNKKCCKFVSDYYDEVHPVTEKIELS